MEIGAAINFYRKYQTLSQKELAEGICSQGEISLIEQGARIPSIEMITKICAKLGISIDAFEKTNFYENNELYINSVLSKLEFFVNNRDYDKMEPYLKDEIKDKYCNNPLTTQCFLCYKGIFINYKEKDPYRALEIFRVALQETNVTSFSTIFDFPKHKSIFSKNETLLISGAASCFYLLNKFEQARHLFKIACDNIDNIKFQLSTQILGTVYYNAGRNLKELGEYDQAIHLARKGLNFEAERKTIYRSAEILYEIGEIYYLQKDFSTAEKYYIKSMYLSFTTNSKHFLPLLLNELKRKKHLQLLQENIAMLSKIEI
jgi:transcriptional regulator with XRE-family HTH domain